jgi:hypothetical protein
MTKAKWGGRWPEGKDESSSGVVEQWAITANCPNHHMFDPSAAFDIIGSTLLLKAFRFTS